MKRVDTLDSVRGAAAIVVVLHHCALVVGGWHERVDRLIITKPLLAGPSAVSLFFVLSGFVLYLTFFERDEGHIGQFLAKRLVRIYPPVFAIIIVSAIAAAILQPQPIPALTSWFNNENWKDPITPGLVLGHLVLSDRYIQLDNVIWSLVVEIRLSLVFPLIALAVRSRPIPTTIAAFIGSMACHYIREKTPSTSLFDFVQTGNYLFLFVEGALLSRYREQLGDIFRTISGRWAWAITIVAIGLLCTTKLPFFFSAVGAPLLVATTAFASTLHGALTVRPLRFAGRISYSLYLVHVPVIVLLVRLGFSYAPVGLLVFAAFPVAIGVAVVFFQLVERPSIQGGRLVAGWMSLRRGGVQASVADGPVDVVPLSAGHRQLHMGDVLDYHAMPPVGGASGNGNGGSEQADGKGV